MEDINLILIIIISILLITIFIIINNTKNKAKELLQISERYYTYYFKNHINDINYHISEFENSLKKYRIYLEHKNIELSSLNKTSLDKELEVFKKEVSIFNELKNLQQNFSTNFKENNETIELIKSKPKMNKIIKFIENILEQDRLIYESLDFRMSNKENTLSEYKSLIKEKDEIFKELAKSTNFSFNKITSLYSDFLLVEFDLSEKYLKTKKRPAYSEAMRIKELKKESKFYIEQYRQMLYKYEILLQLFPELTDYVDDFDTIRELENKNNLKEIQENFDRVKNYVNKAEYETLSIDERNQLALDRYIKGRKTKWQIGRDYELFCGYEYEKDNWKVEYFGIEKKLEDMGRDLIAYKDNEIHIVQCKYWSQKKLIHEKHIAQLYGTTIAYKIENGEMFNVKPVFITNIELSEKAKLFAKYLDVIVVKKELSEFPRIKCNYGKDEYGIETEIYHLPFDQQYDRIIMNRKGNFYAFTVKEAVKNGFRRAYRYYG
jgi:hypothetical protein